MPESSLPVEFLFTLTANTTPPAMLTGAPQGTRIVVGVTGGSFKGPKLEGTVAGPGGDWVTLRANGSLKLDVRLTLQTADGASILMTYNGIGRQGEGGLDIRTAPLFETGDERYAWLNTMVSVAVGNIGPEGVSYDVFGVR